MRRSHRETCLIFGLNSPIIETFNLWSFCFEVTSPWDGLIQDGTIKQFVHNCQKNEWYCYMLQLLLLITKSSILTPYGKDIFPFLLACRWFFNNIPNRKNHWLGNLVQQLSEPVCSGSLNFQQQNNVLVARATKEWSMIEWLGSKSRMLTEYD